MTGALLADLRALAEEWDAASVNDHVQSCGDGVDCARCCADDLRDLAAKHSHDCATCAGCIHDGNRCCGCYDGACCQEPDVSERDELAQVLATQGLYCGDHDDLPAMGECAACDRDRHLWADAILAAGWRRT